MSYKNPLYDLTTDMFSVVSNAVSVPVYKGDVPAPVSVNHVIVRSESSNNSEKNKHSFISSATVIVEIVGIFDVAVDESVVAAIEEDINDAIFPTPSSFGVGSGYSVSEITLQSNTITEDDGTNKFLTRVNRYEFLLTQ